MSVRLPSAGATIGLSWLAVPVGVFFVAVLGYLGASRPTLGIGAAAAVFMVGALAVDMAFVPLLAFPSMFLLQRVGGTLSVSDLVLGLATLVALTQVRTRESPELQRLLWVVVAYQTSLLPTLFLNRYRANYIEWFHELFLVGGSLVVGWVVGRSGRARAAVALYVLPACALAVAACALAPSKHFGPVYVWTYQKNALGDIFAFAGVIAYARPAFLRWRPATSNLVALLCALGTLATQSRQGMVSLAAGIAVIAIRGHVQARRSRMILLAMVPLVVVAYFATMNQLASGSPFDSTHQRLAWYHQSVEVWRTSPVAGVGLRWWYTSLGQGFQPPNAELEMLTSAGIVGTAGFLLTAIAAIWLLWRMDPLYGTVAGAIVIVRLVQGQLDLFWVASQSSFPWLMVGLALGAQALTRSRTGSVPMARPVLLRSG